MASDSSDNEGPANSSYEDDQPKDVNLAKRIYNFFFNSDDESEDEGNHLHVLALKTVLWNMEKNGVAHHTNFYQCMSSKSYDSIVLRRGATFTFSPTFTGGIVDTDKFALDFTFGPDPSVPKGTRVMLPIGRKYQNSKDWSVYLLNKDDNKLELKVFIPPTAGVGVWNLNVQHVRGESRRTLPIKTDIYILFNPWCKDDSVYLENKDLLQEYILNDSGTIYTGTYHNPQARPWTYSQFDSRVLPCVMLLLENSKIPRTDRGSAIKMANAISKMNCLGKKSLMVERRDGNYVKGQAPYSWTSSAQILDKYLEEEKPVGYGQCWVFSAVTTTVCRTLGIPSRSVTNYVSANDTNGTLSIDKFFNKQGYEVSNGNKARPDTVWAFHSWNELWMSRQDLEKDAKLEKPFDGWQAIDTTPRVECQTPSCGPAPVLAIREGRLLDYNTGFFYMEVNSDLVHWLKDGIFKDTFTILNVNKSHVAKMIVTKDPSRNDEDTDTYIDIVNDYVKLYPTPEEREAVQARIRGNSNNQDRFQKQPLESDVHFSLKDVRSLQPGQDINVKLVASSSADKDRTVSLNLTANAVYYTGHFFGKLESSKGEVTLKPKETREVILNIPYDKYWSKLREFSIVRTTAFASVEETDYMWVDEDDFQVQKPTLSFKVKGNLVATRECKVEIIFTSPVNTPLSGCSLKISSPGLKPRTVTFISEVKPLDKLEYTYTFYPKTRGKRKITAVFTSLEFLDVTGSKLIVVN